MNLPGKIDLSLISYTLKNLNTLTEKYKIKFKIDTHDTNYYMILIKYSTKNKDCIKCINCYLSLEDTYSILYSFYSFFTYIEMDGYWEDR